jgi:hypothetical protein
MDASLGNLEISVEDIPLPIGPQPRSMAIPAEAAEEINSREQNLTLDKDGRTDNNKVNKLWYIKASKSLKVFRDTKS